MVRTRKKQTVRERGDWTGRSFADGGLCSLCFLLRLHRGAYTCSQELCLGQPTNKWLVWCLTRCRMLLDLGCQLVMVFDGGRLPRKDGTEAGRKAARDQNRSNAIQLLEAGCRDAAYKMFQKAVDITPALARQFIAELRKFGPAVECIVAPYEADAQLAYLSHRDYIHAVITEDSDLITFGCKRILYKMDPTGAGLEFKLRSLDANTDLKFTGWTHSMFQQMCIMAGCDYLNSLNGVGIKKAHAYMAAHRSWDRALRRIRLDGRIAVPAGYDRDFEMALLTFNHQRVWDPVLKRLVHLTEPAPDFEEKWADASFLGPPLSDELAAGIAEGSIDPDSHQPYAAMPTVPNMFQQQQQQHHAHSASASRAFAPGTGNAAYTAAAPYAPHESYVAPPRVMDGALPGFVKKHSIEAHHAQQQTISQMFPRYPHQHSRGHSHGAAAAAHSTAASSSSAAAAAASSSHWSDKHASELDLAPIPPEVKADFRPPRRSSTAAAGAAACRDVTNTFSASQPDSATPQSKHASSLFSHVRAPPSTFPQKAPSKLDLFERFAFGTTRAAASASAAAAGQSFGDDEEEDQYGFSREEEEAEMALERAADDEGEAAAPRLTIPPLRRPNFLQRSSTGGAGGGGLVIPPPRNNSSTAAASGVNLFLSPPPTGLTFSSPPAGGMLSPSPPPLPLSTVQTASKYFSANRAPLVRMRKATPLTTPQAAAALAATHVHVPDATSFLSTPRVHRSSSEGQSSSIAVQPDEEDDKEGVISDLDPDAEDEAAEQPSTRGRHGTRKRVRRGASASSASVSDSMSKRFKSPLITSSRMTLPVSHQATSPLAASAGSTINFEQFRRGASSAGEQHAAAVAHANTPSPSPSPSPPPFAFAPSPAAPQPFKRLTVIPHARPPAAPTAAPSHSSGLLFYSDLQYASPPSDAPSPSPSPVADPSPSPDSAASVSPHPPPPAVSQPYVEHAAAGFSSQPEDEGLPDEEDEVEAEDEQRHPPLLVIPHARPPLQPSSCAIDFDRFRYQPGRAASAATAAAAVNMHTSIRT